MEGAAEDFIRERVFDKRADGAADRTRAVFRVRAGIDQAFDHVVVDLEFAALVGEARDELGEFQTDDPAELFGAELAEDDQLVETVDELGLERLARGLQQAVAELVVIVVHARSGRESERRAVRGAFRADIRGHDDDRIAEVDVAAERVGEAALLHDLEQHVGHVRVRLFDLVEQHHAVRMAADAFGQLAAFAVPDVAGRGADETAHVELLHELGHVDLDQGVGVAEHELGERFREQGLADAGRSEEDERADGAVRVLQVGTGAAEGARHGMNGVALPDHAFFEIRLHLEQAFGFGVLKLLQRDAGELGKNAVDVLTCDFRRGLAAGVLPRFARGFELFAELALAVAEFRGVLEPLVGDRLLLLAHHLLDGVLGLPEVGMLRGVGDAHACARLVHEVDRLVGQEPPVDEPVGELHGGLDGVVCVAHLVMRLVGGLQAVEYLDRVGDARRLDHDRLEPAFQRGVLFDALAIFVERGRADALEFAAGERGLDDVRGVHGALGSARADERVELVDEEDGLFGRAHLVEDGLDAFLELAAVFRARDHQGQVEHDEALAVQELRHVVRGDLARQPLHDRGLADARLADEDGIVLRAAAEDLDHAFDLVVAADDRVELVFLRKGGQVASERVQRGMLAVVIVVAVARKLVVRVLELVAVAVVPVVPVVVLVVGIRQVIRVERGEDPLARSRRIDLGRAEQARGRGRAVVEDGEEQMLRADVVAAHRARLVAGHDDDLAEAGGERRRADLAYFGAGLRQFPREVRQQILEIDLHGAQDFDRDAFLQQTDSAQKVFHGDAVVIRLFRVLLRQIERLARPGRKPFQSGIDFFLFRHVVFSPCKCFFSFP